MYWHVLISEWLFRRLRATESDTQSHQIRVAEPCGIKCHSDVQSHILQWIYGNCAGLIERRTQDVQRKTNFAMLCFRFQLEENGRYSRCITKHRFYCNRSCKKAIYQCPGCWINGWAGSHLKTVSGKGFRADAEELLRSGVTLRILWDEYRDECLAAKRPPYMYSQFCKLYRDYVDQHRLTMYIQHKPGEYSGRFYTACPAMETVDSDIMETVIPEM